MAHIFHQKNILVFLCIMGTVLAGIGCDEDVTTPSVTEEEVIGTWILTKIIVSYPTGVMELNPQDKNSEATIILNDDKTYHRYQNIQGQVTSDSGSWSVADGAITMLSPSGTFTFPCHLKGARIQISTTQRDPESGYIVPVILEFTKQE